MDKGYIPKYYLPVKNEFLAKIFMSQSLAFSAEVPSASDDAENLPSGKLMTTP